MKEKWDIRKRELVNYNEGDKVWLEAINISTDRPNKNLDNKRYGPFEIVKKVGNSAYKLKLPKAWKIHPVFNEVLLTPYYMQEFPNQKLTRTIPNIMAIETKVEKILDSRVQ